MTDSDAVLRRALALHQSGDTAGAAALYRAVLPARPDDAQLLFRLATAELQLGRDAQSVALFDRLLARQPNLPQALSNRALALQRLGRFEDALAGYAAAIARDPAFAMAHHNRAALLQELGRHGEALAGFDAAAAQQPGNAETWRYRGLALLMLERPGEALASFERTSALKPDYAEAHCNRGYALLQLDRPEEALAACDAALALRPAYAEALYNRGNALLALKRPREALAAFDAALAANPNYAEAHNNRGDALKELLRIEEALAAFDAAIALKPGLIEARNNRANILRELNRVAEAIEAYDAVLAQDPGNGDILTNRAQVLLLAGDFAQGWQSFEARWRSRLLKPGKRDFSAPLWLGDAAVAGKTLLLHAEQGFGDTIQFVRYAPRAAALGAKVVIEAAAVLIALLKTLPGDYDFAVRGEALPPFDFHCPLMSLPLAFGTRLDTIPADIPYLFADAAKRAAWRARLGEKNRPRIGLAWSGRPGLTPDLTRSMPARHLAVLAALPFDFHALQKDIRETDAAALAALPQIAVHGGELNDFSDTAALAAEMDLVISVDTVIAHLAGALGRPLWIMLPWSGEWRWLQDRSDTPWYPGATLWRQQRRGDWDGLVAALAARLREAW
jgi:tetratricopeptide (TPR) repeat protein